MITPEKFATFIEIAQSWGEYIEKLEKENKHLKFEKDFYKSRCELLEKVQKYMKDPERQIVCDILANNNLLPDPEGERYGQDLLPLVKPNFFPKDLEKIKKMNLTQFFDASIKLEKYGYKIHSIEQDTDCKYYFVRFAYADVCSGFAFGGVLYEIQFYKGDTQPISVHKMVVKKLKIEFDTTEEVSNIDEVIDFIIADIQKIEAEEMKKERQKILERLTPRERKLLGV